MQHLKLAVIQILLASQIIKNILWCWASWCFFRV